MHPPLIYCPKGTEFKFHIVEERECHLYPHHIPGRHLGADNIDPAFSASPSDSRPASEADAASRLAANFTPLPRAPAKCSSSHQACHNTHGGEVGEERLDQQSDAPALAVDHATQTTSADHHPAPNGGLVNGSQLNQRITSSKTSYTSYERTENSESHQEGNFENNNLRPQYTPQQSSFNGYSTNTAYSGAPFDYRHHAHTDLQYQYYPYQEAALTPIEHLPQSDLPRHVYMQVEGRSRYYQHQDSSPPTLSYFDHNRILPEAIDGGNTNFPESNPLHRNTTLRPSFNPQAVSFNYWKTNPYPPPNSQVTFFEAEYNRLKFQRCRESLAQLERSNKAAFYNCGHYDSSQGVATNDNQNIETENSHPWVGNILEPSHVNGDYRTTTGDHIPLSRSRSWSESCLRWAMGEVSSPMPQEDKTLSHADHEPNTEGKGKEVMPTPAMSWVNMSTPNSSPESVPREGLCNRNWDASSKTQQVKSLPRDDEIEHLPEARQSVNRANSNRDATSADETVISDSTNLGIVSVKTESEDEGDQARDPTEFTPTPTKVKTEPDDEVKLDDIPPTHTVQGSPNIIHSEDRAWNIDTEDRCNLLESRPESPKSPVSCPNKLYIPKSTTKSESLPTNHDDTTHKPDVQKTDMAQSGVLSIHRPASNSTAPSVRSWSAVVSGKYIPSKSSDPCPPQPTAPVKLPVVTAKTLYDGPCDASSVVYGGKPTSTSRPLEPAEQTPLPETLNSDLERQLSNTSNCTPEVESIKLTSAQEIERTDNASIASNNFTDVVESMAHGEINRTESTETLQPDTGVGSSKSSDNLASTSPTQSQKRDQLPENAPAASAPTPVAPTLPRKPQPRLWSQVVGGSTSNPLVVTKSDSSKDEVNWPSLGSGGPGKGRKRNTTP
ncbi:hypothetical protein CIB48_g4543 [Xylaria polymorpha]|nr:hypothetical protein CIB48_g4543 [Xylaria polymorpha]